MRHTWSILCRHSSIDSTSNVISLFEVLEKIGVDIKKNDKKRAEESGKAILIPIDYELVSFFTEVNPILNKHLHIKIELFGPDGKRVNEMERKIDIPENSGKKLRSRIKINGLPVKDNGEYVFKISIKEEKDEYKAVAELPLEVEVSEA